MAGQSLRDGNGNSASRNGQVYMVNSTNGSGLWVERAAPLFTPSDGNSPCSNYSTQFVPRAGGSQVVQLANKECRMYVGTGDFNAPVADGTYRLVAKHSGKVLEVNGCATTDGANVQQWPWNGGDCQRWQLNHMGGGVYELISQNSGKALDIDGCSTVNGGDAQQWTANGAGCQRWRIEPTGDGYYRLVNQNSGRVLDVDACSQADGQNVQQWEWLAGDCQQWAIEPVSANQVSANVYTIESKNSGKVLDVSGCSNSEGGNVQQWPATGGD